jgi:hypothetical protein
MPEKPEKKSLFNIPDGGISMTSDTGTDSFGRAVLPIKSRIVRVGSSGSVLIQKNLLDHYGFKVGDFVSVILQHREPTEEEVKRIEKREKLRRRK